MRSLKLAIAGLLIGSGAAFAQIAVEPGGPLPMPNRLPESFGPPTTLRPTEMSQQSETMGQAPKDERFPADRDPSVKPAPIPPPASAPNTD